MLCLSNGCKICEKHPAYRDDLVCDECTNECDACHQTACNEHYVIFNSTPNEKNEKQTLEYCSECIEKGVNMLILSKKVDAEKFKGAAERLQEKQDDDNDDDDKVQTKKRKITPDQTLDVDAE